MALITCRDLSLGYDGREIVRNLSFEVNAGDYLCIVGENGSGKSTLMRTLLGLQNPLSGTITFGDGLKKNEIGYLPQQTVVQRDFPASVWEIVLSGCQNQCGLRPFYGAAEKKLARQNIEKMGLSALKKRCYREKNAAAGRAGGRPRSQSDPGAVFPDPEPARRRTDHHHDLP